MYSEKVMDHFQNPRNVGEIENASGVGTVGNAKCGDIMRIYLDIDDNGVIQDCKFKTFGCGAAVATSSMATELVKGKTVQEALLVTNKAVMEALDGLPPVKVHCSLLAEEGIHAALWDYAEKNGIVIEARQKSGTLITVDMALEQGRDVYVVPGRLTDRLSDGCNHLLTQGAGVFLSPESFAEDFLRSWEEKQGLSADGSGGKNRLKNNRETGRNTAKVKLPKESLQKILECLEPVPKTSETLLQELWEKGEYTDISALNRALMELELLGYARQNSPGHFSTSAN